MRAGHAVYRDVVSLFDVQSDLIKSSSECLMSMWDMTEVAFDPIGLGWNVKGEGLRAVVYDL